jgi:hypothetical protein
VPHPIRLLALALALLPLACQQGTPASPAPRSSVPAAGAGLSCQGGDHGITEPQLGWGFCYPATWKFRERVQESDSPPGVDATFDVVVAAPTPAGEPLSADQGKFAFMIVGTYERAGAASLSDWAQAHLVQPGQLDPISWGNSDVAARVAGSRRLLAFTAHHVILLDIREGEGNLDLEAEMEKRLSSWKFDY